MTVIKNSHYSPLTIGDVTIPAGRSAEVPDWKIWKEGSTVIKAWLDAGVISEVKGKADANDDDASEVQVAKKATGKGRKVAKGNDGAPALPEPPSAPALPELPGQE